MKKSLPITDGIRKYKSKNPSRFHMPGHKGSKGEFGRLGSIYPFDVTELPETDNLYKPSGIISESEQKAAELFGSRFTLYSTSGATLCVQTALSLFAKNRLLVDRNCHTSVINSMTLLGIAPVWLYRDIDDDFGTPRAISPEEIGKHLAENPDIKAVFVTSPDYYGTMSDIRRISEICHRHGALLIVDNSHGSHFAFYDKQMHSCFSGADIVIDSLHKTLPVLTGGALLHICSDIAEKSEVKEKMSLFGTSSPSYIIMQSIEMGLSWCEKNAGRFAALKQITDRLKQKIEQAGYEVLKNEDFLKLVINTGKKHITGFDAYNFLYSNKIVCEMADSKNIVLMLSPFNKQRDFGRLLKLIGKIPLSKNISEAKIKAYKTKTVLMPGETLNAKTEEIPIDEIEGKISGETVVLYPPSVPLIVRGELITKELAAAVKAALKNRKHFKIINK